MRWLDPASVLVWGGFALAIWGLWQLDARTAQVVGGCVLFALGLSSHLYRLQLDRAQRRRRDA